jgi:hypothetical protein
MIPQKENNAHLIRKLAKLFSFTPQYIRLVLRGKRHNRAVTEGFAMLKEEETKAINKVAKMKAVKKHVTL